MNSSEHIIEQNKKQLEIKRLFKKNSEANKLLNDESNRLISWSLSIIGGSILIVISTNYVNPTGLILYAYFLFAIGWIMLAISIYYGESLTRSYIAGCTMDDTNLKMILELGKIVDNKFAKQIRYFKLGIAPFAIWLVLFLIWFIINKK